MNHLGQGAVTAGVLLVGDEILSGRVQEANLREIATTFGAHGVELVEARIVPDVEARIVGALNALRAEHDYVVTTGGIGPTHDDVTVDAVAEAFGVALHEHPEILGIMRTFWQRELNAAERRMARTPAGAQLIHGPKMTLPGFAFENVFVMAGVPNVVKVMLQDVGWRLAGGPVTLSRTLAVEGVSEGVLAEPLEAVARAHPVMTFGSYPFQGRYGANLVLRGRDAEEMAVAIAELKAALAAADIHAVSEVAA